MDEIPGKDLNIVSFIAKCKRDDETWAQKTALEKIGILAVYVWDKPAERKLLSHYGAVRLS
eukprot:519232-Heterocapsa_arctica.AAC.1